MYSIYLPKYSYPVVRHTVNSGLEDGCQGYSGYKYERKRNANVDCRVHQKLCEVVYSYRNLL